MARIQNGPMDMPKALCHSQVSCPIVLSPISTSVDQFHVYCLGMGEGYLFRKWFNNASKLKDQQDDWCEAAARLNASSHHQQKTRLSTPFPEDLELESLVALLRGDTKLNIHCYEPHDLEAMVRHSLEYDFEITAFHHALKAWKVPEVIKRAKGNITIATFSGKLYACSVC